MIATTIIAEETPQIAQILQNAIQEIKHLTPQVKVEVQPRLSQEDAEYLRAVVAKAERGELKTITSQEFETKMHEKGFAW